jgi:hypothetical protein
MASGDIPVDGSAVGFIDGRPSFRIDAANCVEDGENSLVIRTTPGKKLHIFVKTDLDDPNSPQFDEDINNKNWAFKITER